MKNDYTVFATMRSVSSSVTAIKDLEKIAKSSGKLHVLEMDVTSTKSIEKSILNATRLESKIDVLINNAGIGGTGWTEAFSEDQVQKMFDVNVFGIQRVMRAVLPQMRNKGKGLIINLSSIQGRVVFPYSGIYTATKFAVEGLTESYHYELAPLGIDVVLLQPGGFKTNFEAVQSGPADKNCLQSYGKFENEPQKIWGKPSDPKDFLPHPQPVADAVINLIEIDCGKRPLRTLVDPLLEGVGTKTVNSATTKAQKDLSNKLGWGI